MTETIEILTADEARDVMPAACNFLQVREGRQHSRRKAAALVRSAGARNYDQMVALLATSVGLHASTKVGKAINDMVSTLGQQQEGDVKKNH